MRFDLAAAWGLALAAATTEGSVEVRRVGAPAANATGCVTDKSGATCSRGDGATA